MKVKSGVDKDAHGREHGTLNSSVKPSSSSSQQYTSTSAKSSSKRIPEAPTKERGKRTILAVSEEPEAEDKRKKLLKRKASNEDDYPVSKRKLIAEQAEIKKIERKEKKRVSEWKPSSQEKSQGQHLSKASQNVTPKTKQKSESINPPTSRENPPSSAPSGRISFKIPKKSNVVKTHVSTADWENVKKSPPVTCKMIDSVAKVSPEQSRTKPTKVSSPVPSGYPPVLQAQLERKKETCVLSRTNALVEHVSHAVYFNIHEIRFLSVGSVIKQSGGPSSLISYHHNL